MRKAVVSLSGGMDSATVLALAKQRSEVVLAVGFTYGSKHNAYENAAARCLAVFYEVPFALLDLTGAMAGFRSDLLLTGGDVPEGHYEAESMKRTVIPGRNIIFNAVLGGLAESNGAEEVWVGVHAGDHCIYPDCRPGYVGAMQAVLALGYARQISLHAPFLHADKAGVLEVGFRLGVPYQLTRTCYANQLVACGRCGSCQERLAAFASLSSPDPIEYVSRVVLPKE